jgi:hypothetical protein
MRSRYTSAWVCVIVVLPILGGCRGAPPGMVEPPAGGSLGEPCSFETGCVAGLSCWQSDLIGDPWCTRDCETDDDCPLGAVCADVEPDLESDGWIRKCAPTCTREVGARGGCPTAMRCEAGGVCEPNACELDAECPSGSCEIASGRCLSGGNPDAAAEGPCVDDADCRPPNGLCLSGSCYQIDCDLGGDYACRDDEVCHAYLPSDALRLLHRCRRACEPGVDATTPTDGGACDRGDICIPGEAALGAIEDRGVCGSPIGAFVAGTEGVRISDPCDSVADCPNPFGYGWCSPTQGCRMEYCGSSAFTTDPCGAGAACLVLDPVPFPASIEETASLRAGMCVRTCSPDDPCPSGLSCNASLGGCL